MKLTTAALSFLIVASASFTIRAEYRGPRLHFYVLKPLTVVLIILVALQTKHETGANYKLLVVAGLLCSLVGDVFLMWPRDRFVAGLVSFLFAHVFYVAAFASGVGAWSVWAAAALLVYGVSMLGLLWRGFGKLKAAVVVYVAAILLMAWAALSRWSGAGADGGAWAAAGALLFVASDSALAWNRFKGEFKGAQALILSTYFAAQWLIAVST
ncbi:MAG TPA: lysoplasmalogenase [Pyrinomonadaceae bacterium]|nr:lysoplasmalogenase [Pyrinomonadaceae bacterium]